MATTDLTADTSSSSNRVGIYFALLQLVSLGLVFERFYG